MGVMAITKVYSVWVVGGAGLISIIIAFFGKISGAIRSIPVPVIGGVSMMLFGVIAASGLRMLIEAKVDFSKSRNLLLSAVILIVGNSKVAIKLGHTQLTGMVLATIVAIGFSLLLHVFDKLHLTNESSDTLPTSKELSTEANTCIKP
jgi:uracil permease